MELDHVLLPVTDLAAAGRELQAPYGLASVEGGRHPDWGTTNRIVPLGAGYLELIAVVDQPAAADSSFGRWVAACASRPGRPLGWAVRTSGLDTIARWRDLTVHSGARVAPSGEVLRWRSAGMDQATASPLWDHVLPIVVRTGRPAVAAIVLATATGEIISTPNNRDRREPARETARLLEPVRIPWVAGYQVKSRSQTRA